jgi:intein-encoded DNA endonuclease-like protein
MWHETLAKIGEILYRKCDGPRYIQDNTEGRSPHMKSLDAAYIAGFFDGDGSVRIQFQPRYRKEKIYSRIYRS